MRRILHYGLLSLNARCQMAMTYCLPRYFSLLPVPLISMSIAQAINRPLHFCVLIFWIFTSLHFTQMSKYDWIRICFKRLMPDSCGSMQESPESDSEVK